MRKHVEIYTDGACSGNPGPGGYGVILMYGSLKRELSGGEKQTTNNRMELSGVIRGLSALREPCTVDLYTDSQYVVLFFRFNQPPELVHRDAGGDFAQDVLARLQRGNRLRHMALHRCRNDDCIDVGFQHIVKHAIAMFDLEFIGNMVHAFFVQIADSRHLDIFQFTKPRQGRLCSCSDNADFDHMRFSFLRVRA